MMDRSLFVDAYIAIYRENQQLDGYDKTIAENHINGFKSAYYVDKNNKVILAFAGQDLFDIRDTYNVGLSLKGILPNQYQNALNLYYSLEAEYGKSNITITGGSFGGLLAQLIAAKTGASAMIFNPLGASGLLKQYGVDTNKPYSNIKNYVTSNDFFYNMNGNSKQYIGTTYIIQDSNSGPIKSHTNANALGYDIAIPAEIWEKNNLNNASSKSNISKIFDQAQSTQSIYTDPILVDLNGDGVIGTVGVKDGVYFDHQRDGFAESSAWVDENDGILAIDKNSDGLINDGSEIFGDNYVKEDGSLASSGFDALKDLDSNNDGIINASDAEFNNIKILKGDGEVLTLEEAGIISINLNSVNKNTVDKNGNTLVSSSTFTKADGSVGNLGDFNLVVDKMNSFSVEWLEESEDIAALPEVLGSGMVYSLHQAMVRDESGELKGLVEEFIAASGVIQKKNVLLQILYKWTGADGVAEGSRGDNFDAKKLYVLEKFIGKGFVGTSGSNPHAQAAGVLNNAFNVLVNNIYASLMSQTELKNVFDMLEIVYDKDTNTVSYDLCKVREYIDNLIAEDEIRGKQLFSDFTHSFVHLGLRDNSNYTEYYNYFVSKGADYKYLLQAVDKNVIQGTDEADVIEGTTGADAVFAGGGDDNVKTRQGDDLVYGGDGNDTIDTCEGDDVIYAGAGDDSILGGEGNNIIYGEDGNDTIVGGNGNDTIYGGDGDDSIKSGRGYDIIYAGSGNDTIKLDQGNATVYGGDGNDDIIVVNGINLIEAGDGNDTITVNAHNTNTTIIGGLGDDYINMNSQPYSQASNIVETLCKYNLGDGNDTIHVNGFTKRQVIEFGEGITRENIIFTGKNSDIIITFRGHEGSITLKNGLGSTGIEKFILSNGDELLRTNIMYGLKTYGDDNDNYLIGSTSNEVIYGYGGNDTIYAKDSNDTIYGGDGDDYIDPGNGSDIVYAGSGNDTIRFEKSDGHNPSNYIDGGDGDDYIETRNGNNTVIGGKGNDNIKGSSAKDTYIYNLGDGNDTIVTYGENDILEFGEGITRENTIFRGVGHDLLITFKDSEGSIIIKNPLYNNSFKIEKFKFANGEEFSYEYIVSHLTPTEGTEGNDSINGSYASEIIYGYGGNDTISAGNGNDIVYGGDGDDIISGNKGNNTVYGGDGNDTINLGDDKDTVYGGDGDDSITQPVRMYQTFGNSNKYIDGGDGDDTISTRGADDTIIGGKGNDSIQDYGGNDTYIYNLGDGNDTIEDGSGSSDILEFGEGITRENTFFRGSGHDLLITFKDNEGSIRIKNTLYNSNYKIEKFKFANGEEFSYSYVVSHLTPIEGTEGNDSIKGSYASEIIYGYGGNDTINGGYGNDTIYGGDGDDSILGSEGNDVIYGEDGNDFINPGKRNDHVYGGLGNDTIRVTEIDYQASKYIDGGEGDDEIEVREGSNTIIGGKGDDYLSSAYGGNDTYIYNFGDGNDTIENWNGDDVLQFGEGITRENTIFRGSGRDLLITFKDSEGSIRIKNPLYNPAYAIDKFKFADGEELDYKEISTSDINKIIQDMTAYNTAEDGMISYSDNIDQEKELMTLVNSSM